MPATSPVRQSPSFDIGDGLTWGKNRTMETDKLKARFETKYTVEGECWIWHGHTDHDIPVFPVKRRYRSARQVALKIYTERNIPPKHVTRSTCGNPLCVNPDHVTIIPRADIFGHKETHVSAKLTQDDVDQIRTLLQNGLTHTSIAQRFDVSRPTISQIARAHNWRGPDVKPIRNPYRRPDKRAAYDAVIAIARAAGDLKDPDVRYRIHRVCTKTHRLKSQHAVAVTIRALCAVQKEREESKMTVPDTPAFAKDDRVQIHNERSVLHGLAGTVVEVDHVRPDPYRVKLDGAMYPMWLREWELRPE